MSARASAPATTANLGPGFDVLAFALALRITVEAAPADDWEVRHLGAHHPPPGSGDGVLAAAMKVSPSRPLRIDVTSDIPPGRGLGSSTAAAVAGAAAALRAAGEEASVHRVFRVAAELDGHPEQAAAATLGGLTLAPAEGFPVRLPLHPSLRPIVAIPDSSLPTVEARAVLPDSYPRQVVIRSLARVSALTAGLVSGDADLLAAAHGDELHESRRSELGPEVSELMESARSAGALHVFRSGAGPAVVALATADVEAKVVAAFEELGVGVLAEPVEPRGLI